MPTGCYKRSVKEIERTRRFGILWGGRNKKTPKKCLDCGKELCRQYVKRCWDCYKISKRNNNIIKKKNHPILYCKVCKKEFSVYYYRKNMAKFCSRSCKSIFIGTNREVPLKNRIKASLLRLGSKSHWWKNGITPLHKLLRRNIEFKYWREKIFERDNFICQKCFLRGNRLHPHHLKPFAQILREFLQQYSQFSPMEDKETLARLAITYAPFWDINNGITLCEDCHKEIHNNKYNFKQIRTK